LHAYPWYLHSFPTRRSSDLARQSPSGILDFGCGEGQVVEQARSLGLEFYGADVFYEGEEDRKKVAASGLLGTVVREIRAGKIPLDRKSTRLNSSHVSISYAV